jgi:DNA-binding NarL/FixJ family response regulator
MGEPDLDVVAEARDGEAALECIQEHRPDVAILDIDMPKKDGFDVVRAMEDRKLSTTVVFLTMHKNEALFNGAMDLGVRGYVLKDSALAEVVDSVKAVAAGHDFVSPALSTYLLGRRRRGQDLLKEQPGLKDLTPAERRILQLIADGKSTGAIALPQCSNRRAPSGPHQRQAQPPRQRRPTPLRDHPQVRALLVFQQAAAGLHRIGSFTHKNGRPPHAKWALPPYSFPPPCCILIK